MKIKIDVEDGVLNHIIDEVFDRYKYNMKFVDPDEVKEEILGKMLEHKYNNIIVREKYPKFSLVNYFNTMIRCHASQILKKRYDESKSRKQNL